jgi:hypothetical protein
MFKVKTKETSLNVSLDDVFETIFSKIFLDIEKNQNIKNVDEYIEHINKKLSSLSLDTTNRKIYSIYFLSGYYYKLFLEKNDVTILEKKEEK